MGSSSISPAGARASPAGGGVRFRPLGQRVSGLPPVPTAEGPAAPAIGRADSSASTTDRGVVITADPAIQLSRDLLEALDGYHGRLLPWRRPRLRIHLVLKQTGSWRTCSTQ